MSNIKKSLIWVILISLLYIFVQTFIRPAMLGTPIFNQVVSIFYLWSPGFVALYYAKVQKVKLSVFAKPNKAFLLIPVFTIGICLVAFLLSIPFGATQNVHPLFLNQPWFKVIGYALLFFLTSYILLVVFFPFLFLGGELYWRGFLWDRLKKGGGLKAVWIIAAFWSLWQIPLLIFSYSPGLASIWQNVIISIFLNFALAPLLAYFREKGKSVFAAAFFYSSLIASFTYFLILFPNFEPRMIGIYGGFTIGILFLSSLGLKLFSSSTWKKLV